MSRETVQTLFHPFGIGELDMPAGGASCIVLGAGRDFAIPGGFDIDPIFVQGFRPDFLALQRRGLHVAPEAAGEGFALALIVAGKHRGQNERRLADAIRRVVPGGLVVLAGGRTEGIASLRKRLEKVMPFGGHLSKSHGVVFWLWRGPQADEWAEALVLEQTNAPLVEGRFETAPGMFSHDRVDHGSRLLAGTLSHGIGGMVADFCAGWGYLSVVLAEYATPRRIDLYEADHASLEAARRNLARLAPDMDARFHWSDLAAEKVERIYDAIVMNPPFHEARAADPALGQSMIRAAANALKPRGRLLMVANRGLPYEALLKTQFASCETVSEDKGFRVYSAIR
ncbi:MAG: class I SAM-dependent methyltransferase [Rhizobiaceae bacterium]|nr:class I SAM-dependent methyltransferase [Rhizobiaceae bacterium]